MLTSHYGYFLKHNLESRFLKKRKPLLAGFKITYQCNLKCSGCPFWKLKGPHISFDRALAVLDQFYKAGIRLLIFEGGEPFLWRHKNQQFSTLVREARQRFFCTGVTTNGTLPLETEADVVWVSIDGLRETHDQNRGKTFDRILSNIDASSHPNILANVTINRINYKELPELVKFLTNRVKGITVQFYYPYAHTTNLWLPEKERTKILDTLIELKRSGYPLLDSVSTLSALKDNRWRCHPWLIASAEPDGRVTYGCYLKNRADISCEKCGFAAHTEISKAYDWNLSAIWVGRKIFKFRLF